MNQKQQLINEAALHAETILQANMADIGMMASADGYPQVWARDSVITMLGAALSKNEKVMRSYRTTLETLAEYQTRFGQIPNNVWVETKEVTYYASDSAQWFIIGAAQYAGLAGSLPPAVLQAVDRALDWCAAQELDNRNLMISGEASDWADLLANHGKVLFPNILHYLALRLGAELLAGSMPEKAALHAKHAGQVAAAIQNTFRVYPKETMPEDTTHYQARQDATTRMRRCAYFLPWVDLFSYGERFDTTANLLCILAGAATQEQTAEILQFIEDVGVNRPYPVQVLYPAIQPGESDWREYYKTYQLNLPHQYHNGGIWPWVGGLYVAALVKAGQREKAVEELALLAESVRRGRQEWEFNEWLQGQTGAPMGAKIQAWSAGMYLYAKHAVDTGELPVFTAQYWNEEEAPHEA